MKGFVFFDLDGTLLNNDSTVDSNVIQAIDKLKQNGYEPIIATGRTLIEIDDIMEIAKIPSITGMNGQCGFYHNKLVFEKIMDPTILERLKEMALSRNEHVAFYNYEKIRITGHNETAIMCYERIHSQVPPIDPNMHKNTKVNMALILSEGGDEEYKEAFPELTFIRNGPMSMDVIPKGGSKAEGIKSLLEALEISDVPTYAFGDGQNDLEMFDYVDYGIAMGNAVDSLKEKASYITETNVNNGIEQGLKYYNLI